MKDPRKIEINNDSQGRSYAIQLVPNQKVVQIHRHASIITFDMNKKALQKLSANAYVLYMFLLLQTNNRIWALSSKAVCDKTSLTKNTYPKAVEELVDTGYLTKGEIDIGGQKFRNNAYHLWEDPDIKS